MSQHTIFILGGYGNTGRALTGILLDETSSQIILAGRDSERARGAADDWNTRFAGERVRGVAADAADSSHLSEALTDADLLVVASSTSQYAEQVASAALEAGVDYLDPQYSREKLDILNGMAPAIEAAGCCFITEGGFHPGLPAALVRYAGDKFETLQSARVGSVIKIDWAALNLSEATLEEFTAEFMDYQALHFHEGRWQRMGWLAMMKPSTMRFAHGFERQYCLPMFLEEMRYLPEMYPDLEETGFYVGGFNWFVDWLVMPLGMALLKLWPKRAVKPVSSMMDWGLRRFSRPPFGTLLKLEARGVKDGLQSEMDLTVYHEDGYVLTAAPMAACVLQLLAGALRQPGLWLQGLFVEPARLLRDLQRMGVEVTISEDEGEPSEL
jgi:saccharopine dehydrogenase (NAD+, L-lysine-forming)